MLIHFWWWEFALHNVARWNFAMYFLVILYAVVLYLICALLFPDHIAEYRDYEHYFMSRRKWFFGLLAFSFILDVGDTALKGTDYLLSFAIEYPIRIGVYVILCIAAMFTANRRFHQTFVVASLIYQISFIARFYPVAG
jgi:hypothetical protein